MTLLDLFERKSRSPIRREHLTDLLQRYGDQVRVMTWANSRGDLAGWALLQAPVTAMGRITCGLLAAVSDGTIDSRRCLEEVKNVARNWGADTVMFATSRNPRAIARRFGAVIDSVNLRLDLKEN